VRQSVAEQKQKQNAWTNHKLGSPRNRLQLITRKAISKSCPTLESHFRVWAFQLGYLIARPYLIVLAHNQIAPVRRSRLYTGNPILVLKRESLAFSNQ
jgi:hypothetical protein